VHIGNLFCNLSELSASVYPKTVRSSTSGQENSETTVAERQRAFD